MVNIGKGKFMSQKKNNNPFNKDAQPEIAETTETTEQVEEVVEEKAEDNKLQEEYDRLNQQYINLLPILIITEKDKNKNVKIY